ncbi:MAG: hypothetical protein KAJ19_13995 [Gammaproteobacteria bacterium]|nr:hypothetical protein [Gammaproteobacteria bacterium]
MAVTYPLTPPSNVLFRSARFSLLANTAVYQSPLSKTEQRLERAGALWAATYVLPVMQPDAASEWTAFFTSLRGRFGTFYGYDPARTSPRGIGTGTPLVNGASQTGHSLVTDGWTISQTGIMKAGDPLEVDGKYYMMAEDVNSDGSGNATLEIEPKLRTSPPTNDPITVTNPKVIMRLADDAIGWDESTAKFYRFQFNAVEVLP